MYHPPPPTLLGAALEFLPVVAPEPPVRRHFVFCKREPHTLGLARLLLPHGPLRDFEAALDPLDGSSHQAEPHGFGGHQKLGFPQALRCAVHLEQKKEQEANAHAHMCPEKRCVGVEMSRNDRKKSGGASLNERVWHTRGGGENRLFSKPRHEHKPVRRKKRKKSAFLCQVTRREDCRCLKTVFDLIRIFFSSILYRVRDVSHVAHPHCFVRALHPFESGAVGLERGSGVGFFRHVPLPPLRF